MPDRDLIDAVRNGDPEARITDASQPLSAPDYTPMLGGSRRLFPVVVPDNELPRAVEPRFLPDYVRLVPRKVSKHVSLSREIIVAGPWPSRSDMESWLLNEHMPRGPLIYSARSLGIRAVDWTEHGTSIFADPRAPYDRHYVLTYEVLIDLEHLPPSIQWPE